MNDSSTTYQPRLAFLLCLVGLSVIIRLFPYMAANPEETRYLWGVSPLFAIGLFGASYFREKRWAYAVPLASYFVSDVGIWLASGRIEWGFHANQPFVYLGAASVVAIGFLLRRNRSFVAVGSASLLGPVLFYIISNFGMWATGDGNIYPHTLDGLVDCYVMAIPYFRNNVLSTLVFSALLFSPLGVRALEAADDATPATDPIRRHDAD